jgi:hypothetical protein
VIGFIFSSLGGGKSKIHKKKSTKKPTDKRVKVGHKEKVAYEGLRGGEYIKQNGGYVSLKKL